MNAAASSADMTLSATAWYRTRDRSVIHALTTPGHPEGARCLRHLSGGQRPGPGGPGHRTGYGSRHPAGPAGHPRPAWTGLIRCRRRRGSPPRPPEQDGPWEGAFVSYGYHGPPKSGVNDEKGALDARRAVADHDEKARRGG